MKIKLQPIGSGNLILTIYEDLKGSNLIITSQHKGTMSEAFVAEFETNTSIVGVGTYLAASNIKFTYSGAGNTIRREVLVKATCGNREQILSLGDEIEARDYNFVAINESSKEKYVAFFTCTYDEVKLPELLKKYGIKSFMEHEGAYNDSE